MGHSHNREQYDALESQVQQCCANAGIVTSWILIAEVKSPDDTWGLNLIHDRNSPSWRYQAILNVAQDIIDEGVADLPEIEDHEEEG